MSEIHLDKSEFVIRDTEVAGEIFLLMIGKPMKVHKHIYVSGRRSAFLASNFHSLYLNQCIKLCIIVCDVVMCVSNWSNHQKLCCVYHYATRWRHW